VGAASASLGSESNDSGPSPPPPHPTLASLCGSRLPARLVVGSPGRTHEWSSRQHVSARFPCLGANSARLRAAPIWADRRREFRMSPAKSGWPAGKGPAARRDSEDEREGPPLDRTRRRPPARPKDELCRDARGASCPGTGRGRDGAAAAPVLRVSPRPRRPPVRGWRR
jgi:hypothetical protein